VSRIDAIRQWWRRRTIRFRLALWYAVGGTLLLAGFSATIYSFVAVRMAGPLDGYLRGDLNEVIRRLEVRPDGELWWNGRGIPRRAPWTTDYPWFEVWDENGKLVRRLWPFAENRVQQVPSAPARGRDTISIFYVAPDLRLRVLSVPYKIPGREQEWMLRIIRIHEPVADAMGALRLIIIVTLPIVVGLIVLVGYFFTRQWLLPLDRMAAEAQNITVDDLSRRLPVANSQDELGRLATRSVGEVGLRRSRTVEEYREIIGSMLEEAQRLQLLIQRLLELASAEGGPPSGHRTPIRIDEYAAACVSEIGILAEYKQQQISLNGAPCTVVTDPVLFRQALQNLLDNAIKYSPDSSSIRVEIRNEAEVVEVAVTDEGPGITPENRAHLMERFFRPDRARGRHSGGFGLGLSITKAYMRIIGGSIHYEPAQPRGSTFRLVLPKT
jgi:signal transduction histidine kinase